MHSSVYRWSLRPETGLSIELRVVATNASGARREVNRFLREHGGAFWTVESISREAADLAEFSYRSSDHHRLGPLHPQ